MRKIDENKYVNYTIAGDGWSYTIHQLPDALREWKGMRYGTFYGNKPDGSRAILDTKTYRN